MGRTVAGVLAAIAIALSIAAPSAGAQISLARAQYISQADPICATGIRAVKKDLKGVSSDIFELRGDKAARKFRRAKRPFGDMIDALAALRPPDADASLIASWLGELRDQQPLVRRLIRALKRDVDKRARIALFKLERASRATEQLVVGYGFQACDKA
jgi:hypothetical protein